MGVRSSPTASGALLLVNKRDRDVELLVPGPRAAGSRLRGPDDEVRSAGSAKARGRQSHAERAGGGGGHAAVGAGVDREARGTSWSDEKDRPARAARRPFRYRARHLLAAVRGPRGAAEGLPGTGRGEAAAARGGGREPRPHRHPGEGGGGRARFRQADVDLIFLYVTTYALSATVLPVVRRAKVPVIVLNLSPAAAIDYQWFNALGDRTRMTGEWLAYCQACSVPEIANVFNGARGSPSTRSRACWTTIPWPGTRSRTGSTRRASAYVMEHNRLGVMGHYYGGMLDIYSDLTQQCAGFGGHVEIVEVDELASRRAGGHGGRGPGAGRRSSARPSTCSPTARRRSWSGRRGRPSPSTGSWSARLGSLAYYYMGVGNPANEDAISSIILGNSLLTARGVPMAGEMEIKNVQAMKILDTFGVGGLLHRVLRHGLQGRRGAHGPRRAGPPADRGGQDQGAAARGLPRQGGPRPVRGDVREARADHVLVGGADGRAQAQAAGGRRRVGARARPGDREHEQPLSLPDRRPRAT